MAEGWDLDESFMQIESSSFTKITNFQNVNKNPPPPKEVLKYVQQFLVDFFSCDQTDPIRGRRDFFFYVGVGIEISNFFLILGLADWY